MDQIKHLTDAEWQIMRVLWENKTCSSKLVTSMLQSSTNWSPTTVKTFLSRLTEKNYIEYEKQGKMHLYYPILSERDCVALEMKGIINNVYGGKLLFETDNFQFYGLNNESLIQRLSLHLERSYHRIHSSYSFCLNEKQTVFLYSSQSRLHSALGLTIGPQWLRAGWEWDILHISPEEDFTDISAEKACEHVFIQRAIHNINPLAPYWILQGVAAYESNILSLNRLQTALDKIKNSVSTDTIFNLSRQYDLFRDNNGYELAFSVIKFIVDTFGIEVLNKFIRNPQNYFFVFKIDEDSFWTNWVKYVSIHDFSI
ncbi:MAG: BlaI/MecI/CopY family transcriptional regulator [Candidatus Izemoplasmatales bacterium]|nr:BlaI/MecI/CopY family transcriptional regulator [Candidatus Izemoplasmatales bacterium]